MFCGHCKHFSAGYSDRQWESCAKAARVKRRNHVGEWTDAQAPARKNVGNACPDFRKGTPDIGLELGGLGLL